MATRNHFGRSAGIPFAAFILSTSLAATVYAGDFANVVGGNGSNGRLLALDFDANPPVAIVISNDSNGVVSIQSADFFEDTCNAQLDVVVADSNGGQLIRYKNPDPGLAQSGSVICANGDPNCPSRPNALAFSAKRRGVVAEPGDAGLVPRLYVFDPLYDETDSGNCDADDENGNPYPYYPFDRPRQSGQLQVCGDSGCVPVGKIEDAIFVEVPGGGSVFQPGALLVLTSNPTTLSIVEASTLDAIAGGTAGSTTNALILAVPSDFDGDWGDFSEAFNEALAIAIIQNSAGIGTADGRSDSEETVVATKRGQTIRFRFYVEPDASPRVTSPTLTGVREFIPEQGNGSLDLAFGIVGDETFAVIADRQRGNFMKILLENVCDPESVRYGECIDTTASPPVPQFEPVDPPWPTTESNVEQPQAVAINVNGLKGRDCDSDTDGCPIRNTVTLQFTDDICEEGEDPTPNGCTKEIQVDESENIIASIRVVSDPRTSFQDLDGAAIGLPGYGIPAICGGIPLADNGDSKVLVIAEIAQGWAMTAGNLAKVQETVENILPQAAGCSVNGTRHFYHETRDNSDPFQVHQGDVYDTTWSCINPSGGGKITRSVSVICSDQLFEPISPLSGNRRARAIKDEANKRIAFLRDYFGELEAVLATDGDPEDLASVLTSLRSYLDAAEGELKRKKFAEASAVLDQGSIATHAARATFVDASWDPVLNPSSGIPASAYAFTLIHFMNMAFFTYEDGVGRSPTPYLPPCGLDIPGESEPDTCRTRL